MGSIVIKKDTNLISELTDKKSNLVQYAISMIDDVSMIFMDYVLEYTAIGATNLLYDLMAIDVDDLLDRLIYSDAPEWDWVVGGTKAHDIYPVEKESLYWPELGHPLPKGRGVHHPGTAPNDFPARAYMDAMGNVETRLDDFLDQIVS